MTAVGFPTAVFLRLCRPLHRHLCRREHIFDKNPIPPRGVIDEDMRDRPY